VSRKIASLPSLLAFAFLILGLGYDTLTPIFENSDETLHYPYVKHLADGQGLPIAQPNQLTNQEATQPPFYYAIVAASTVWLDTNDLLDHLQYNPHWLFTEVRAITNDNQNRVLHGPMDAFPYHRAALAIHIGRWWSLLFGCLTVICTFYLSRHLFPDNLPITVTATSLVAFNPQFLRVSATVSNDSLSAFLTTLTVLLTLRFLQAQPRLTYPQLSLLGLLGGLTILTKLSSISIIILVMGIIMSNEKLEVKSEQLEVRNKNFLISHLSSLTSHLLPLTSYLLFLIVVVTFWWFYRNHALYGEWFATETHLNLAGRGTLSLPEIWQQRDEIQRAYWATFGWGQIRLPEWVYQGLSWFSLIGLLGMVVNLAREFKQNPHPNPLPQEEGAKLPALWGGLRGGFSPFGLSPKSLDLDSILTLFGLTGWVGLNFILYLRWVMEVGSVSHTRLMFPAIAAIGMLLALGWHSLMPQRAQWGLAISITASFLAINLYALSSLLYPAFTPNETWLNDSRPAPINLTFANHLMLLNSAITPTTIQSGNTLMVQAEWQATAPITQNYSLAIILLAPTGEVLAHRETYPGLGLRPTRYLSPQTSFIDSYPLHFTQTVTQPFIAQIVINPFDFNSTDRAGLSARDATGHEITPIVGQVKITPNPWPIYQPRQVVQATFDEAIKLIGYDITEQSVTFYWQSLNPVSIDYTVFVHLLDEAGNVISQHDAPPTNNIYPTHWWSTGEIIADRRELPLNSQVKAMRFGLYDLLSGQRLPVTATDLPQQDNAVTIKR